MLSTAKLRETAMTYGPDDPSGLPSGRELVEANYRRLEARIRELAADNAQLNLCIASWKREEAEWKIREAALEAALRSSPCPRPLDGEDTVELCIKAGHCGCDNKAALQAETEVDVPCLKCGASGGIDHCVCQKVETECRIYEYDGAFKCYTHDKRWGAITNPDQPCAGWSPEKIEGEP